MFSTPLIASSSGAATVSAMVFGFAPGYTARTTTDGGTTSGYSVIGRRGSAIRPATKMMIDSTAAKIGRSMKNLEKSMRVLRAARQCAAGAAVGAPAGGAGGASSGWSIGTLNGATGMPGK